MIAAAAFGGESATIGVDPSAPLRARPEPAERDGVCGWIFSVPSAFFVVYRPWIPAFAGTTEETVRGTHPTEKRRANGLLLSAYRRLCV